LGKPYNTDELKFIIPSSKNKLHYRIFICHTDTPASTNNKDEWEELKVQRSMAIRSLFERYGFHPAISVRQSEIAIICFFNKEKQSKLDTDQCTGLASEFQKALDIEFQNTGISGCHSDISKFTRAYKEANEVLYLNKFHDIKTLFYENIGIYRLLFQ